MAAGTRFGRSVVKDWPIKRERIDDAIQAWRDAYEPFTPFGGGVVEAGRLEDVWREFAERLGASYPFFHPSYAGQMLKPPHPIAMAGYAAAMAVNPNNHALDGGPATSHMEKEVVSDLVAMFGFPEESIGHLTSGGTIANLEALWVGRETEGRGVAHSADAHYTHSRMAGVLGIASHSIAVDSAGRMDVSALRTVLESEQIGTVVATAGTTGLGSVDPIADILELREEFGFRLHIDAAYGGFFRILADAPGDLSDDVRRHFAAISQGDSIVVDPHKHGLQPYGCGAVIFRDPAVGKVYRHDSPYTYFTSNDLHLGEISLECSRAGAAAAALWLTIRTIPLSREGLGVILQQTLKAARDFHDRVAMSDVLRSPFVPELDIVVYHPDCSLDRIDQVSAETFARLIKSDRPTFVSLYRMNAKRLGMDVGGDIRILRSVLMKPEHAEWTDTIVGRVEAAVRNTLRG
jgi:glutamate/tyrosine decarboxylase-like PLP-dependent enzyme